jgi:hypothetical protein
MGQLINKSFAELLIVVHQQQAAFVHACVPAHAHRFE